MKPKQKSSNQNRKSPARRTKTLAWKEEVDEDAEEEVFELNNSDSDSDDPSEGDSDIDESDNDLNDLVENLPDDLKRKVLSNKIESEDEYVRSDDEEETGWGKKSMYWEGDTADLEIGQDVDDAEEEENAVKELHVEKSKRMKDSDFFDVTGPLKSCDDEENLEALLKKNDKGKQMKKKTSTGQGIADLEFVSLDESKSANVQVEQLTKDINKLSRDQRLALIQAQSPEMLGIVQELQEQMSDLKTRILPLKECVDEIAQSSRVDDDLVEYLEVKLQLLLAYCINVVFYLYMKAQGKSVRNHPVMKQLVKLRYIMEKLRPMDAKLQHQIDRLLKVASSGGDVSAAMRANPASMLGDSDEEEDAGRSDAPEISGDELEMPAGGKTGVYKAPKMNYVPYHDGESAAARRDSKVEKQRKKLRDSEMFSALREEFGDAPEEGASSGVNHTKTGDLKRLQEEEEERIRFEEDRFVRMTMTKKDKQSIKKRTAEALRLDNFDDIGDVGDFDELDKLTRTASRGAGEMQLPKTKGSMYQGATGLSNTATLQRAMDALVGGKRGPEAVEKSSKKSRADANPYEAMLEQHGRRRAPDSMDSDAFGGDGGDFGGDDEDEGMDGADFVEEFGQKKRQFKDKKKNHYTAEPRFGGYEETLEDGQKRAATYEIMKNKGLTPHRKKENRNPRVKKREQYAKKVIQRKGQVRDVITGAAGSYSGEMTGIKANVARSRKIHS